MSAEVRHNFGKRLRMLRKQKGHSLREFARIISVDKTYYSELERGLRSPTLDMLERIAFGMDTTIAFLVFEIDRTPSLDLDGTDGPAGPE